MPHNATFDQISRNAESVVKPACQCAYYRLPVPYVYYKQPTTASLLPLLLQTACTAITAATVCTIVSKFGQFRRNYKNW